MNQQLTENEIKKLLEHLNYPSQADIMQQQLFFTQTETIRQQRINDERIVEALMNIAANSSSGSARNEANKTLKYLGITLPPINPKLVKGAKARDIAIGFFGWIMFHNLWLIFIFAFLSPLSEFSIALSGLPVVIVPLIFFAKKRIWIGSGIVVAVIINSALWATLDAEPLYYLHPFLFGVIALAQ